jgi:hypothetical protein
MLYELRVYRCVPGRLPALHKRFQEATLGIWQRLEIRPVGFWTMVIGDGNHDLYYMLEWRDMAERERKWGVFAADPEWLARRAESERDGQIVANITSSFLAPTAYSKMK